METQQQNAPYAVAALVLGICSLVFGCFFGKHKEGIISHCFDAETVKLRVVNGDGAQWIQKRNLKNCLSVLDAYQACSQKQGNERIKKRRREKRKNPPHDGLIKILWYDFSQNRA